MSNPTLEETGKQRSPASGPDPNSRTPGRSVIRFKGVEVIWHGCPGRQPTRHRHRSAFMEGLEDLVR